jgi:hypothetical protein
MIINRKRFGFGMVALGCATLSLMAQLPTIPPSVTSVAPPGVRRGATITLTIEGRSLTGARAVLFDSPGLSARILGIRDLPEAVKAVRPGVDLGAVVTQGAKQEAKLELTVAPDAEAGTHRFRIQTLLGTSNSAVLDVGVLPEIQEIEANDSPAESQKVELPATLVGTVGRAGDVDTYQFDGKAGQEVVFETVASSLGSELQSVLVLRDSAGRELARAGDFSRQPDAVLMFKLPADGKYTISISDLQRRGGYNFFYRVNAGPLPYVTSAFPLGLRAGQSAEVEVQGSNLGSVRHVSLQAPPSADGWTTVPLRVKTPLGESLNRLRLAVGNEPEMAEKEPNNSPAEAQPVTVPVTINGHIWSGKKGGPVDEDYFRFSAKRGERLVIEVAAARLGSPLDSVVEVLDAQGHDIPQATVRSLVETSLTLSDRDSRTPNFRLTSISGIRTNDYLMMGDEVVQIIFVPDQPDEDLVMKSYEGERIALFNTSPQAHSLNSPVYKVRIAEPGEEFPPNGLPLVHLTYRNDDGGPDYESDSRLAFIAPKDGDYLLHIKDVRGLEGEDFAYRLTIRQAQPDFRLSAEPSNPNIPRGGRLPVVVTANRTLGYEGPIGVEVKGLPKGVRASPATIPAGQDSAVVVLTAPADASAPEPPAAPFQVVGRAKVDGRELVRVVGADDPLRVASLMPSPDLVVTAEPGEIVLEPGKEAPLTLHCERKNSFRGRVPYELLGLPPGIVIVNIGFTGGFVTEKETSRTITLRAEEWAQAVEQPIYVVGTVESNSSTRHASLPLILKVLPKKELATPIRPGGPVASNR